jgi:hypothetical protein
MRQQPDNPQKSHDPHTSADNSRTDHTQQKHHHPHHHSKRLRHDKPGHGAGGGGAGHPVLKMHEVHLNELLSGIKYEHLGPVANFDEQEPIHVPHSDAHSPKPDHDPVRSLANHSFWSFLLLMIFLAAVFYRAPDIASGLRGVEQSADAGVKVLHGVYGPIFGFVFGALWTRKRK